jgi:uncharacterized protein (DUF927 family)
MSEHDYRNEKNPPHSASETGSNEDQRHEGHEEDTASGADDQAMNDKPHPIPSGGSRRRRGDGYPHGEHYDKNTKYLDVYFYNKADNSPYGMVKRTDQKQFPQFYYKQVTQIPTHNDERNWQYGEPKPKILYNLPKIAEAAPDATLYIAEGEKDADTLIDLGLLGTCNSGGAASISKEGKLKGWALELNETCKGHPVVLFEDNDWSGGNHVRTVVGQLKDCCPSIKVVRFREFPKKGFDVTAWAEMRAQEPFGKSFKEITNAQRVALGEELLMRAVDFEDFGNEAFTESFLAQTKDDPSAPFEPEIIEALAWLKLEDAAKFQRIWTKFKRLKVSVGDLKKLVDVEAKKVRAPGKAPDPESENDGQPKNFEMTDTELLYYAGEQVHRVCSAFEVVGESRDPNGNEWGLLLSFHDRGGKPRFHHVKFNVLHGDGNAVCAELGGAGLMIEYDRHKELGKYLCAVRAKGRVVVVNRPGWVEVDGERRFIFPGQIATFVTGEEWLRIVALDVKGNHKQKGTLDEWKENVALRIKGHYVPMFAVCNAFIGPLLLLTKQESGGMHLQTLSGQGKTIGAAGPAASVWGDGSRIGGYMRSWTITANGLESLLVGCNDTCVVLDEINQADSRVVYSAAYQIANGVGKQRMNRNLTMREAAMWNVWLISTGEATMEQKITESREKAMAGQLARIIDVPVDRGRGFGVFDNGGPENNSRKLAEAIEVATSETYGTAGPEFVSQLQKRPNVGVEFESYKEEFLAKCGIKRGMDQVARVAKKFALIAFAGRLAFDFGLLPWDRSAPEEVALWAFNQWMGRRGGVEETEEMQAVRQVKYLMEQHSDSRFEELRENAFPVNNRLGFRKRNKDGEWEYWVMPETWREVFCKGFSDPTQVAKWLEQRGMLRKPGGERSYQSKRDLGGGRGKNQRVYVLTSAVLEDRPPTVKLQDEEM